MATHEISFTITGPFSPQADPPLDAARRFYEANGYAATEGGGDEGGGDGGERRVVVSRGRVGAGWTSSDMTALRAVVTIVAASDALELAYVVDVTGQRLSDEDRQFFEREAKAARAYLRGKHEAPLDLRDAERARAESISAASMRAAWRWGVAAFVLVAIALIVYHLVSAPARTAELGRSLTQPLPRDAYRMPGVSPAPRAP